MIECQINKQGTLEVNHQDVAPTVYLDHWALRKISADRMLADRLRAALKSQNGTLVLSWLNLSEFRKVTREDQVRNADNLFEAIHPRVFFLEVDFDVVISREDELLAGGHLSHPTEMSISLESPSLALTTCLCKSDRIDSVLNVWTH